MPTPTSTDIIPVEAIAGQILTLRSRRIILDSDLARLYGVETKVLNQSVKRNPDRFPEDFMFQLTKGEFDALRSQIVTSKSRGGRQYFPYAFTEHGALMAANVLRSERAVEMSVYVVRAFIQQRKLLANQETLSQWLVDLQNQADQHEGKLDSLLEQNDQLLALVDVFSKLLSASNDSARPSEHFGFAAGTSIARKKSKSKPKKK